MSYLATPHSESFDATFAFVDLAGFTALTETHGDAEALDLIDTFVAMARASLGPGDQLVKCLGDAVMLRFPEPMAALDGLGKLLVACVSTDYFPVPRTGLHHGPALERDGDWFGATVNLAARIAAQAQGGQTLTTSAVALAARNRGIDVVELGCFGLRNVAEPVELFELALAPVTEATSIDPVCRMQVRHERAAGRLRYDGHDYWFCSLRCAGAFAADPGCHATGT